MSDSTALIIRCGTNYYFTDGLGGGERYDETGCHLLLVDIRFENIYWEKVLNGFIQFPGVIPSGFNVIDSTLFFYYDECGSGLLEQKDCGIKKIATVHMDEKFLRSEKINIKYKKIELEGEGWSLHDENFLKIRHWRNGSLLAYHAWDANPYALLDTAAGTMELWQPSGEFEWLNGCTDYKWSQTDGLCVIRKPDDTDFVLLKNGVDTLAVRHAYNENEWSLTAFNGNYVISGSRAYPINKQGQVSEKPLDVRVAYAYNGNIPRFFGYFHDLDGNLLVNYNKGNPRDSRYPEFLY
jgi:hypothetical protein